MVYNISHALREQEAAAQHATLGKRARKKGGNNNNNNSANSKSVERAHRVLEIEAESMLEVHSRSLPCRDLRVARFLLSLFARTFDGNDTPRV